VNKNRAGPLANCSIAAVKKSAPIIDDSDLEILSDAEPVIVKAEKGEKASSGARAARAKVAATSKDVEPASSDSELESPPVVGRKRKGDAPGSLSTPKRARVEVFDGVMIEGTGKPKVRTRLEKTRRVLRDRLDRLEKCDREMSKIFGTRAEAVADVKVAVDALFEAIGPSSSA
jgi:hypothetical protein